MIRWAQSNQGQLHLCRLQLINGKWMGKAICGCVKKNGWKLDGKSTKRCEHCDHKIQFVLDAISEQSLLDTNKPVCEPTTV